MSIQGNVNQIISLSTLLATTSPQYKAAGEKRVALRANKQALKTVEERYKLGQQEQLKAYQEGRPIEEAGALAPVAQERADLLKERYKLDPSLENWEAHKEAYLEASEVSNAEKKLNERSATGEAFLEDFKQQLGQVPVEERMKMIAGIEDPAEETVQEAPKTSPETPKKNPSMVAREDSRKALEEAQGARRLGRISTDWRPYL